MKINAKHSKFTVFQTFAILCIMNVLFSSVVISNQNMTLKTGDMVEYTVLNTSETTNLFYGAWPPGDYYGNWTVSQDERVIYEITNDTANEMEGTIILGNYTFNNVRNIDVASALALSIYPWNGGFFANASDWTGITTMIENTNTSMILIEDYEQTINSDNYILDIYEFNVENYYGQYSLFRYDVESGTLLNAFTSFGYYHLNVSLSSTNIDMQGMVTNAITFSFLPTVVSFILVVYFLQKRLRKM